MGSFPHSWWQQFYQELDLQQCHQELNLFFFKLLYHTCVTLIVFVNLCLSFPVQVSPCPSFTGGNWLNAMAEGRDLSYTHSHLPVNTRDGRYKTQQQQGMGREDHDLNNQESRELVDIEQRLQLVQSDRLSEAGTVHGERQVENNTQTDRMEQMMTILTTIMQSQMELDNKRKEDRKQLLERQIQLENRREENRKKEKKEELAARSNADEERKEKERKDEEERKKKEFETGNVRKEEQEKELAESKRRYEEALENQRKVEEKKLKEKLVTSFPKIKSNDNLEVALENFEELLIQAEIPENEWVKHLRTVLTGKYLDIIHTMRLSADAFF